MSEMKKLAEQGAKAQAKLDAEAAELEAWTPPTQSWSEWWRENEGVRNSSIARINAFQSDNLIEFRQSTHTAACEWLCDDCAALR